MTSNQDKVEVQQKKYYEKPRICCLDLDKSVVDILQNAGFHTYSGTLGKKIKLPQRSRGSDYSMLLNYDYPSDLHEYDIVIMDLAYYETIPYVESEHTKEHITGNQAFYLVSQYPETLFDPRPYSNYLLEDLINDIVKEKKIVIVFTTSSYTTEYFIGKIDERDNKIAAKEIYNIFQSNMLPSLGIEKQGTKMVVCESRLEDILKTYISNATYNQTFKHPTIWENNQQVPDPKYFPLIKNSNGEIVSIIKTEKNISTLYLPQFNDKDKFLHAFLTNIAPEISPELFPDLIKGGWKYEKEYFLPNHEKLIEERVEIEEEYQKKLQENEENIKNNIEKYSFLHNILTETGESLVNALIEYFRWLGFENVKDADKQLKSNILEEDIQISLDNGLLIIECKGIGGKSSDSDCSQVSKVRYRRSKERGTLDVYALYIVNHQRHLAPKKRQNPPFSDHQIQDALNDDRGLCTTWQLFNLYFDIEKGLLDKESARKNLLSYGLIEFKPPNLIFLGEPKEFFSGGIICIINLQDMYISVEEEVFVEKNGSYKKATIMDIQLNDISVPNAKQGQVGLKLNIPIKKGSRLYKKTN
ncbi:MAG: hypothetical protein MUC49_22325 [Raineya sp.]|nr:hypothetical protein [Raineya sp.]